MLNQQSWLTHVVLHSWCSFSLRCNPFFEIWICKWLSERIFKHPAKKRQRAGSSKTKHFRKPSHSLTKENCFSLFRSRRHFGEWIIKRPETLILSQEEICVSKEVNENVSLSRTIHHLSIWNKPLIDTCQYCSTSRANQALRSLANSRGLSASVSFLPLPLPPLSFFRPFFGLSLLGNQTETLATHANRQEKLSGIRDSPECPKVVYLGQDWARKVREFSVKSIGYWTKWDWAESCSRYLEITSSYLIYLRKK